MRRIVVAVLAFLVACGGSTTSDVTTPVDASTATDASTPIDAASGNARPLGSVGSMTEVACANVPGNATCKHAVVTCPGIPDLGATLAVLAPAAPTRTIVGFSGGGGDSFLSSGIQALAMEGSFRIVLVKWDSDWEKTPSDGILAGACRPATILQAIFDGMHGADRTKAFCATGHSGGSGQISYALAHYGREEILDYAALSAGPPFGRIDYGCAPSTYTGPPRNLCPLLPNAVLPLPDKVDGWENTTTCGSATASATDLEKWKRDSVVSSTADYDYPKTPVGFFDCTNQPNGTTGGAFFYSSAVTSEHAVFCFDGGNDGCQGESLGKGVEKLVSEIVGKCVPRHN